jgi:hypothetical protein
MTLTPAPGHEQKFEARWAKINRHNGKLSLRAAVTDAGIRDPYLHTIPLPQDSLLESPTDTYMGAYAAFGVAASRVESLTERLPHKLLEDWKRVRFSNTDVQFPSGTTDRSIDANVWEYEDIVPARELD